MERHGDGVRRRAAQGQEQGGVVPCCTAPAHHHGICLGHLRGCTQQGGRDNPCIYAPEYPIILSVCQINTNDTACIIGICGGNPCILEESPPVLTIPVGHELEPRLGRSGLQQFAYNAVNNTEYHGNVHT